MNNSRTYQKWQNCATVLQLLRLFVNEEQFRYYVCGQIIFMECSTEQCLTMNLA